MAEVPQHLLDKAKARRAALAGGAVESGEPVAAAPATTTAAPPKTAAAPRAAAAAPKPVAVKEPAPPSGTGFARMGSVFLLTAMPLWGLFMFNAWATPRANADSPAAIGKRIFAQCATCHGANGAGSDGGGVGRPLWKGEAEKTFPDPVDQAIFVKHGSCSVGAPYGDPQREGGQHVAKGGMPAFGALSDAELLYLVNYERYVLNGKPFPVNPLAKVGDDATVAAEEPFDEEEFKLVPDPENKPRPACPE